TAIQSNDKHQNVQKAAGAVTPPPITCSETYSEDPNICEIDLETLQQTEHDKPHPAILLNIGRTVTWQWRHRPHKFKFDQFVQVDCDTEIPNNGGAHRPFMNKFDDDDLEYAKWSTVSPQAVVGSCFKHVITLEDGTTIDPHVIIGPGTGLVHRKLGKPGDEGSDERKAHPSGYKSRGGKSIDPSTCLQDGTCQDCPEPKSDSLCEISTEWLRKDSHSSDHLPLLLHQNQEVIWYTPLKHATINVDDFSEVDCSDEKRLIRKKVKDVVKMKTGTPAPAQLGFIGGKVGSCYKHNIIGSGGGETGVDPHVIIGPGIQ